MTTTAEMWLIANATLGNVLIFITLLVIIYQAYWGKIAVLADFARDQVNTIPMLQAKVATLWEVEPNRTLLPV